MTRIEIKKGYINPNDGQNVIVELENGMLTGAVYEPVIGLKLHDTNCFLDVEFRNYHFTHKPVAYFVGEITE